MKAPGLRAPVRLAFGLASISLACVIWELASQGDGSSLIPPPSSVLNALWQMGKEGQLLEDVVASARRAVAGYIGGCTLAVGIGLLTGRTRVGEATIGTIVQVLRPIPVVAMVPLAIVWFGLGESSKLFLVVWGTFFPVWINTYLGVREINPQLVWAAASLGASQRRIFVSVVLPAALSHIIAGMRTAIATAFVCLVAAEMAGAFAGLGYRVEASHLVFRVDRMLAALAVLGVLGATSDAAFAALIRKLAPWHGKARN